MLDIKRLRNDLDSVKTALANRGEKLNEIDKFIELDEKRRSLIFKSENLKETRNKVSENIAILNREKQDTAELISEMKIVSNQIKEYDQEIRKVESQLETIMYSIPNIPHESVPTGLTEEDNVPVRHVGTLNKFSFEPKPHWDIAKELGILDFESAAKVTGSRFVFYRGLGAKLERALINFMIDLHIEEHGYEEVIPPYIVNRESLIAAGQLPKFEEDLFKLDEKDYFLIPTSEVPLINIHRDDILSLEQLPIYYVGQSSCFRSEAGSAGRDTRGLIRQHQFNKVELVKITRPEESYHELEKLTLEAEKVLQLLNLPYRVLNMCMGDLGFTAAKKYDIEVWLPSYNTYREISSCSNLEDFQARRANIRFRRELDGKTEFAHTLNGSGLAVGRTVAAILENYQQEDGSVIIPEILRPYMNGLERITKQ
ncbi:serine--tRNA ligase [Cytobacillus depressus]|uniref:Serine--tRNA ligase n=1 Tax=Cytobacillus depressus TaxID=1602942 RepID=A0A6L3V835_9BACI|nr:serine--tRNA ligase [Cytobacillus depressus]KAB2337597.1 serine--tRNA ligase [Cytobacillus depressus]